VIFEGYSLVSTVEMLHDSVLYKLMIDIDIRNLSKANNSVTNAVQWSCMSYYF